MPEFPQEAYRPLAALVQNDVRRALARHVLRAFIAERARVDVAQEMLAFAEQNGPDRKMYLVDQPGAQILPNRRHAATEAHIAACGRGACLLERRMNAFSDEAKLRAALHANRRARVMRQHEHRRVIRRLLAPPALPALIGPGAAHRAEHVASQYPCTNVAEALLRHLIVDTGLAA